MVEEKVYVLDNGTELIVFERIIFKDTRYLLLGKRNTKDILVACEKNEKLFIVDENSEEYKKVFSMLYAKYKSNN